MDMRKLLLLAVLLTALPLAAKIKHKDKRFEPAPLAHRSDATGRYVGPDASYVIELRADGTASMNGSELTNVTIDRNGIAANGRDGKRVRGAFFNRILNGDVAFGILLDEPPFDLGDGAVTRAFYRKR